MSSQKKVHSEKRLHGGAKFPAAPQRVLHGRRQCILPETMPPDGGQAVQNTIRNSNSIWNHRGDARGQHAGFQVFIPLQIRGEYFLIGMGPDDEAHAGGTGTHIPGMRVTSETETKKNFTWQLKYQEFTTIRANMHDSRVEAMWSRTAKK